MMSGLLRFLFCLILLLHPLLAYCSEQHENRERLAQIRQRIDRTSQTLRTQRHQELTLLHDLGVINTSIKESNRRIRALRREQQNGKKNFQRVTAEISQGKKQLHRQQHKLQKRLKALYKEGNTGILKVIFASDSPMILAEQYVYFSRILSHDKKMMLDFRRSLTQQQTRLGLLQQLHAEQQKHLIAEKAEREDTRSALSLQAKLLRKVRHHKSQLHAELLLLQKKEKRLKALIANLESPPDLGRGEKFSTLKGKLQWPLKGSLLVGFGTQKNHEFGSLYMSHGIEISAKNGEQLHAVAPGKVVFASWFKGYGNLMIVAHAGGYHTLYAQADSLLKKIGQHVQSGDPIAVAGLAGQPGIYFEIRKNGVPLNPLSWLRHR